MGQPQTASLCPDYAPASMRAGRWGPQLGQGTKQDKGEPRPSKARSGSRIQCQGVSLSGGWLVTRPSPKWILK